MEVRPRRAAEAFWRCEQAFERRTRDMTLFPPLFPPSLFIPFRESTRCWMDGGALAAGFRGIRVEWLGAAVVAGALKAESKGRYILLVGTMSRRLFTQRV